MKMSTSKAVSDNKEEDIGVKEKQTDNVCLGMIKFKFSSKN